MNLVIELNWINIERNALEKILYITCYKNDFDLTMGILILFKLEDRIQRKKEKKTNK